MAIIEIDYLLPGVYTRHDYKPVPSNLKVQELYKQLGILINKPFNVLEWKVLEKMYTIEDLPPPNFGKHQCICSCTDLCYTFIIKHESGLSCTIGSECINHFGDDLMTKIIKALKNHDNRCIGGKLILNKRTKLGKQDCCGDLNCGCVICSFCNHHKKECTCNYCINGNLITTGTECGNNQCPCYKCKKCKKTLCNCHKCLDCKELLEEVWKSKCLKCFKKQNIKRKRCLGCKEFVYENWKSRCLDCFKNQTFSLVPKKCLIEDD